MICYDEKEEILCVNSPIMDIVTNKLIYKKEYNFNFKTYCVGNIINNIDKDIFKSKNMVFLSEKICHRPSCTININKCTMVFTDINQVANYIINLKKNHGHNVITCDFHWKGYNSAHLTTCYFDLLNEEYNYFDINQTFDFSSYKKRNIYKKIKRKNYSISNGHRKTIYEIKCNNFNNQNAIKPMILWIKTIVNEIHKLDKGIKLKLGRYSFYKQKNNNSYEIRTDIPNIHDCPKELENGTCTFYCRWIDILMNIKDKNNKQVYNFENSILYIVSLNSSQRKIYIKKLFNMIWNIYITICTPRCIEG